MWRHNVSCNASSWQLRDRARDMEIIWSTLEWLCNQLMTGNKFISQKWMSSRAVSRLLSFRQSVSIRGIRNQHSVRCIKLDYRSKNMHLKQKIWGWKTPNLSVHVYNVINCQISYFLMYYLSQAMFRIPPLAVIHHHTALLIIIGHRKKTNLIQISPPTQKIDRNKPHFDWNGKIFLTYQLGN